MNLPKSEKSPITKNLGWSSFNSGLELSIGFLISILLTRYLGPHDLGKLTAGLLITMVIRRAATSGIQSILSRKICQNPETDTSSWANAAEAATWQRIYLLAIPAGIILFLLPKDLQWITTWALLSILSAPAEAWRFCLRIHLLKKKEILPERIHQLLWGVNRIGLILIQAPVPWFTAAYSLGENIKGIVVKKIANQSFPRGKYSLQKRRTLQKESLPFLPAALLQHSQETAPTLLLSTISLSLAGQYWIGYRIFDLLQIPIKLWVESFTKQIFKTPQWDWKKTILPILTYCVVAGTIVSLYKDSIVETLYGEEFLPITGQVIAILCLSLPAYALGQLTEIRLLRTQKDKSIIFINTLSSGIALALLFPATQYWGIIGTAGSVALAFWIKAILQILP